MRMDTAQQLH